MCSAGVFSYQIRLKRLNETSFIPSSRIRQQVISKHFDLPRSSEEIQHSKTNTDLVEKTSRLDCFAKTPLCELSRSKDDSSLGVFCGVLCEGISLTLFEKNLMSKHKTPIKLWLDSSAGEDGKLLMWRQASPKFDRAGHTQDHIPLDSIQFVEKGLRKSRTIKNAPGTFDDSACFTVITNKRTLEFGTVSIVERDAIREGLILLLCSLKYENEVMI